MSATQKFPPSYLISDDSEQVAGTLTAKSATQNEDPISREGTQEQPQQEQLSLPAPSTSTSSNDATQQLNVSTPDSAKHTISFDYLGPLVVNKDGTLSRIHNWAQMTDSERERTMRVLGKRNMLRKEAILDDSSRN